MDQDLKIALQLSPYQAMQLLRWKPFIMAASQDPLHKITKEDKDGLHEAFKEIEQQVLKKITLEQLNDAFLTKEIKKL